MADILTSKQKNTLKAIITTDLAKQFYFSGGTALSHYYLQHRYSEDLDFFKKDEFDVTSVTSIIKTLKPKINYSTIDFQTSLNRNLYFLHFLDKSVLKLEFTYYPFEQIETPNQRDGLLIDSAIDIAANKIFTIVQTPRGRDYYDLYSLVQKYGYTIPSLRMLAKQKFDWHIDPLMLGTQFNKVASLLDDPILVKPEDKKKISQFFENEAQHLSDEIIKE